MDASSSSTFDTTAFTFFVILVICFTCIILLLVVFLYKCFQGKDSEELARALCSNALEGEDCLAANVEANKHGKPKRVLPKMVNLNAPVRPGILVQRHSKEAVALEGREDTDWRKDTREPEDGKETKGGTSEKASKHVSRTTSATENHKRPLKGVTFSKEVIVVDLGNDYPAPRSYPREHKERK